jgi:hypothetical protein
MGPSAGSPGRLQGAPIFNAVAIGGVLVGWHSLNEYPMLGHQPTFQPST